MHTVLGAVTFPGKIISYDYNHTITGRGYKYTPFRCCEMYMHVFNNIAYMSGAYTWSVTRVCESEVTHIALRSSHTPDVSNMYDIPFHVTSRYVTGALQNKQRTTWYVQA